MKKSFHPIVIVKTISTLKCRIRASSATLMHIPTKDKYISGLVMQLVNTVCGTVLQMPQLKSVEKHPAFFLHLVVKTPNSMTVYLTCDGILN